MKFIVRLAVSMLTVAFALSGPIVNAATDAPASSAVSPEYLIVLRERINLLTQQLKNSEKEYQSGNLPLEVIWKQRLALDTTRLLLWRAEAGHPPVPGAAEAVLRLKYAETYVSMLEGHFKSGALPETMVLSAKLDANQAKLDYLALRPQVKNPTALEKAIAMLKDYPTNPVTDTELKTLLAVEAP